MTAKTLRDAAGILLAEADKLEGKISNTQTMTTYAGRAVTAAEAWALMVEEISNRKKPHEWRDFGNGVLPEDSGNGETESPLYESHKTFWRAMEQQRVPDHRGFPFLMQSCVKRGGWPEFESAVRYLWNTPEGIAWRAHPLNANLLPKTNP